jgi:uncharacterized protein
MKNRLNGFKIIAVYLLLALAALRAAAQEGFWLGQWEGNLSIGDSELPAVLHVIPGGALLDLPNDKAFGWPVDSVLLEGDNFSMSFSLGVAPLEFTGKRGGNSMAGTFTQNGQTGKFTFQYSPNQPDHSSDRSVDIGTGKLPGTLELPKDASGPVPLIIILAGSGTTDRNGNNWQVPGRNDSLALFADALAQAGVASYRYDKRGAGEAYRLGGDEASLVFADHVSDAVACIRSFEGDSRFSHILVFGHGDGALIGAAALREAPADGLIAMGVSGRTLRDLIGEAASGAPDEYKAEINTILAELDAGRFVDKVSPYLENLFRRSFQPYLASWLKYDLKKELADLTETGVPVLLMQGDLDMQVTMEEFNLLRAAAPKAEAVLLPQTNHMLKAVGNDVEENYASFSDPSFPISPGLVPAIQDFLTRFSAPSSGTDPKSAP